MRTILCSLFVFVATVTHAATPMGGLRDPAWVASLQPRAATDGGGSPAWIDLETVAGADTSFTTGTDQVLINEISLGAGQVSKFRIYSHDVFFNFAGGIKAALYTTGNAIVGTTSDYGSVTITAGNQYFEITFATPQTVTAGTYRIAWCMENGGQTLRYNDGSSRVSYTTFDHSYAAFPVSNLTGLAGADDLGWVVSVFAVAP